MHYWSIGGKQSQRSVKLIQPHGEEKKPHGEGEKINCLTNSKKLVKPHREGAKKSTVSKKLVQPRQRTGNNL